MPRERIIKTKPDKKKIAAYINKKVLETDIENSSKLTIDFTDIINEGVEKAPEPKIQITPLAYTKIMTLVFNSDKELAWHGTVVQKDGAYVIVDIVVYPQIVTDATVDADEAHYTEWLMSFKENIKTIRMQGHSHVSMGTSPSGTDLSYYADMMKNVKDFYIFMIINKRGESHWRFYDKLQNVVFIGLKPELYTSNGPLNMEAWATAENTKIKPYVYIAPAAQPIKQNDSDYLTQWQQDQLPFNQRFPKDHYGD